MNLGGLLAEFERYAKNSYIANIKLSIPEVRDFLKEFLTRRTFFINGLMYYGATSPEDGEPRFVFSEADFTTDDYIDAILPELISVYTTAYGAPRDRPFSKDWSPKPFKAETDMEKQQDLAKVQNKSYARSTLLFSQSFNVSLPFNPKLRAGNTIFLQFPLPDDDLSKVKERRKVGDDKSKDPSGTYLIEGLKHIVGGTSAETQVSLVRDTFTAE